MQAAGQFQTKPNSVVTEREGWGKKDVESTAGWM